MLQHTDPTTAAAASVALAVALACDDPDRAAPEDLDELDLPDDPSPAPPGFAITKVTTGGKGCKQPGSVTTVLTGNKKVLRLLFHDMTLSRPPGELVQHTQCAAAVELAVPAGWRVAPALVSAGGHATLEQGVRARQTSRYFFAGVPLAIGHETELDGEFDGLYGVTKVLPKTVWSACGGPALLGIDAGLVLDATDDPGGFAEITLNSQKILHWKWKQC